MNSWDPLISIIAPQVPEGLIAIKNATSPMRNEHFRASSGPHRASSPIKNGLIGPHRYGSSGMRLHQGPHQESLIGPHRRGSSGTGPHQESELHRASSTWQQWGEASPREYHRGFIDVSTRHIYQRHGTTSTVARCLELRYGGIVRTSWFSVVVQPYPNTTNEEGSLLNPISRQALGDQRVFPTCRLLSGFGLRARNVATLAWS